MANSHFVTRRGRTKKTRILWQAGYEMGSAPRYGFRRLQSRGSGRRLLGGYDQVVSACRVHDYRQLDLCGTARRHRDDSVRLAVHRDVTTAQRHARNAHLSGLAVVVGNRGEIDPDSVARCGVGHREVKGWGALQVVGKGRRLCRVPINRPAADALLAYLADRDDAEQALFLNRSQGRFSVRGIALLVNRYLRAAGITDRSGPHVLRHTFATHALRARPNLRAVQELLGHAWVTTTQRYTHLEVEDLQAQVADLPANRRAS